MIYPAGGGAVRAAVRPQRIARPRTCSLLFGVCVCGYHVSGGAIAAGSGARVHAGVRRRCLSSRSTPCSCCPRCSTSRSSRSRFSCGSTRRVAPPRDGRFLTGSGSDIAAAILIGVATYSKINHGLLIAPIVLWLVVAPPVPDRTRRRSRVRHRDARPVLDQRARHRRIQLSGRRSKIVRRPLSVRRFDGERMGQPRYRDEHERRRPRERARAGGIPGALRAQRRVFSRRPPLRLHPVTSFPASSALVLWLASPERWRPWRILTFLAVAGRRSPG